MGSDSRWRNEAPAVRSSVIRPLAALAPGLAIACLLVAGCSRGVDLRDASMEEVGKALNGAARQEPGLWETSTALEAMDLGPGAAPRDLALVSRQIGQARVQRGCLSAEQASAPGFGQLRGGVCRFDRFVLKGGRLDARMHCTRPDAKVSLVQQGAYTGTGFDMRSTLRQESPGGATTMTLHLRGRRLGACTAANEARAG